MLLHEGELPLMSATHPTAGVQHLCQEWCRICDVVSWLSCDPVPVKPCPECQIMFAQ